MSFFWSLPGYVLLAIGIILCRRAPESVAGTVVVVIAAIAIEAVAIARTRALYKRLIFGKGGVR
jgi:hypothetical protein